MLKRFYKQLIFIFIISSLIILISSDSAIAKKGTKWHVFPWMTRAEIQAVVDGASDGDTIFFHSGTYDWTDTPLSPRYANEGAIKIIDKTLTIKGQEGTLIIGPESGIDPDGYQIGAHAFHVLDLDTDNDVTFDGLAIQTFMRGIVVFYNVVVVPQIDEYTLPNGRNVTIRNCTFTNTQRQAIALDDVTGDVLIQNNDISTDRRGIIVLYRGEDFQNWQPEGTFVHILENTINAGNGIYLENTTEVLIKGNIIDCTFTGIRNDGARERTAISSNSILNCRDGIWIWGGWWRGSKYEAEEAVIEKNKLINITRYGILLYGDLCLGHAVSKNEIHMVPDPVTGRRSVSGIYLESHDDYFGQNKISGSGLWAFCLAWWDYSYAPYNGFPIYTHNETLQANNVNQFSPDICHFYLDYGTHDNLIVGSGMGHSTYVDDGYDNRITGVMPMAGGIGQDLSEAVKEKNEDLKEARKIIL